MLCGGNFKLSALIPFSICCQIIAWTSYQTSVTILPLEIPQLEDFERHALNKNMTRITTSASRPPLESLIQDEEIIGDPQFLLDFAVVGYAKCGTTTMMDWLSRHSETRVFPYEVFDLSRKKPAEMVRKLYTLEHGKRGYKSPYDMFRLHAMDYIRTYWPRTKLIVGIRHPVLWFESWYNFRVNAGLTGLPPATKLMDGRCHIELCTDNANFALSLARLGKTDMTAPEEVQMKRRYPKVLQNANYPRLENKIFLFDVGQLADTNETRTQAFQADMQEFLGLTEELPPLVHKNKKNATKHATEDQNIDICERQYDVLRAKLMESARFASVWIRKYFIESEDVVVSSKEHFQDILMTWMHDPCDSKDVAS